MDDEVLCFAVALRIIRSSITSEKGDAHGLNHIINLRQKHYSRQQQEQILKKGTAWHYPGGQWLW